MKLKPSGYLRVKVKDVETVIPVYGELSKRIELEDENLDESFCPNPFEI